MEILIISLFILVIGCIIGSFLNVVALRALSGESIVFPSSKCPKCNTPIKWYDNIPVFSYLFTFKGKCRNCKEKVSLQYPIVEALTGLLFLASAITFGLNLQTLLVVILLCISIVISITDIKEECIFVHHAVILAVFAILTSLYSNGIANFLQPLIGLVVAGLVMEIVARLSFFFLPKNKQCENDEINRYVQTEKRAFGEGDTYIAMAIGALLGWKLALIAMFGAIILQAIYILPKFLIELYNQKYFKLLISLLLFTLLVIFYGFYSNIFNFAMGIIYQIVLIILAINIILGLRNTINKNGFTAMPFGPALLIAAFLVYFYKQF